MEVGDSDNYRQIDDALFKIANRLSKIPCLPKNLDEEKEKFFKDEHYHPKFKYEKPDSALEPIKLLLNKISIPNTLVGRVFSRKRDELIKICEMMQSVGTTKFSRYSKELLGFPNSDLVSKAKKLITIHDEPEKTFLSVNQTIVRLEKAMERYGFDWQVKQKDMASKACVNLTEKILYLKEGGFYTNKFVNRLIVHEIGTHIMRYENGLQQPYKIFSLGLTNYLGTEEGLAVANEERHGCLTRATLKTYAARVFAVNKALKCNFRETYNALLPFVGKDNAWEITMRVKRGVGDTFYPGAFTKDYLYLKGFFDIKNFLAKGGNLQDLYYGKIDLDHLEEIKKVPGMINPMFLAKMKHYVDYIKYPTKDDKDKKKN